MAYMWKCEGSFLKAPLFADDKTIYISDPKNSSGTLLELIHIHQSNRIQNSHRKISSPPIHVAEEGAVCSFWPPS